MEPREPVHRLVRRRPLRARAEPRPREAGGSSWPTPASRPDVVHTSLQTRAIRTANLALDEMGRLWLPVRRSWRLNERHYGDLTRARTRSRRPREYGDGPGEDLAPELRRPAAADRPTTNPPTPAVDPRYAELPPDVLPAAECLKDVVDRMLPYWYDAIVPDLRAGRTRARRRPRQQPAGPGEAPRPSLTTTTSRAQHPHRGAARLRARRRLPPGRCEARPASVRWATPRRCAAAEAVRRQAEGP